MGDAQENSQAASGPPVQEAVPLGNYTHFCSICQAFIAGGVYELVVGK